MLDEQSRRTIDKLSRSELVHEINRGRQSKFQGDKFDYLKTRLALVEQEEHQHEIQQQLGLDAEGNQVAREANQIARSANATARKDTSCQRCPPSSLSSPPQRDTLAAFR